MNPVNPFVWTLCLGFWGIVAGFIMLSPEVILLSFIAVLLSLCVLELIPTKKWMTKR